MLPFVAGGDLGGVCCGAPVGRCGVVCDEEKRELILLIHDGRREVRGSSLPLLSVLARLSRVGRLFACALFADVWGEGVVGRAGSVFCLGCDRDGGVTCEGAVFLDASGEGW